MADTKGSALTAITGANTAAGDKFLVLDISDTTQGAGGTWKIVTRSELLEALSIGTTNVLPEANGGTGVAAGNIIDKGQWDASAGTFPGSGSALQGWLYRVSVAGTIDSQTFAVGDAIMSITENASETTYASNWFAIRNIDTAEITKLGYITVTGAVDLDAIPLGNLADMATASILGRDTAGSGSPEVLSASTVKDILGLNTTDNVEFADITGISATLSESGTTALFVDRDSSYGDLIELQRNGTTRAAIGVPGNNEMTLSTGGTEAARFDSSQSYMVGKTLASSSVAGFHANSDGFMSATRSGGRVAIFNRQASDGTVIDIWQADTSEGDISVSGTTVSYNGAHLSRWSQWEDAKVTDSETEGRPEVLRGTILSNVNEMCEWFAVEWDHVIPAETGEVIHYKTKPVKKQKVDHEIIDGKAVRVIEEVTVDEIQTEKFPIFENGEPVTEPKEIPVMEEGKQKIDDDGEPVFITKQVQKHITKKVIDRVEKIERTPEQIVKRHELYDGPGKVGDVIDYTTESGEVVKATIVQEANEQLNRMKVSDVAGDKSVSGVFQDYDLDDDTAPYDFHCAMTGDFVIRISKGVKVENGDLIESAGDGTGRPQTDDVIRASTVAKVTSTTVTEKYEDGSYTVPCVLMAC